MAAKHPLHGSSGLKLTYGLSSSLQRSCSYSLVVAVWQLTVTVMWRAALAGNGESEAWSASSAAGLVPRCAMASGL